jgi:hypothetical protein
VPGVAAVTPAADAVPAAAASVVNAFVAGQLAGDLPTLRGLGTADLSATQALIPGGRGVLRSYVIKAALAPDTGQVTAQVRLVRDASHDNPAAFADENLVLARQADGSYLVSSAGLSDFQTEPNGPEIVHVASERQGSALVLRIAFDSDLDPATVNGTAVSLTDARGNPLSAEVTYEVESRTAVVSLANAPAGTLTLLVGGSLHDVAGQALASSYSTSLQS